MINWIIGGVIVVGAILFLLAIIIAEEIYYSRHPEKERPDPNPYP